MLLTLARAFLYTAVAMACAGCDCGHFTRHAVHIALGPQFAENSPPIEVVITAVPRAQKDYLSWDPVSRFFQPEDDVRRDLHSFTMRFGPGLPTRQSFSRADAAAWSRLWKAWQAGDASSLVIIASLPGHFDDHAGPSDRRRVVLSLIGCDWRDDHEAAELELTPAGLELLRPENQRKRN